MSQKPLAEDDPFSSVDSVSTEIFDRLPNIGHPEALPPEQAREVKSRLQRLGEFLLDAAQKPNAQSPADDQIEQPDFGFAVFVENDKPGSFFALAKKPNIPSLQDQKDSVSYRAARQRVNLPEGIELLEGNSTHYNEADIMSAIKVVMVEQKREFSRETLPELEPADPAQVIDVAAVPSPRKSSAHTVRDVLYERIVQFYRQDTVLAISLTIWAVLLGMMLINPEAVLPVFLTSVYFGVVVLLIFKPGKVIETFSRAWQKLKNPDVRRSN